MLTTRTLFPEPPVGAVDVLTPDQRRLCMSRNRGMDTTPEVRLRKACWAAGLRYVLGARLPGRPDFALPRYRVAVFVDGCFWHGCSQHYRPPVTKAEFWKTKLERNRARDAAVGDQLAASGWTVVRVWEHDVRRDAAAAAAVVKHCCDSQPDRAGPIIAKPKRYKPPAF